MTIWKENGKIEERGDGMTIEEMKKRKRELGYTYEQISKMSNGAARNGAKDICGCDGVSEI